MKISDLERQLEDQQNFLAYLSHCLDDCACSTETKDRTLAIAQYVFDKMQEIRDLLIELGGDAGRADT